MADDARGRRTGDPFTYRVTKDGRVLVSRGGRQVRVVAGAPVAKLAGALDRADGHEQQLLLARLPGTTATATIGEDDCVAAYPRSQ